MPSGNIRGHAPTNPRDLTGKRLKELQQQQELGRLNATRDIDAEIKAAHKKGFDEGYDAGLYAGIHWVQENYDVFELEDEDDEMGIVSN